MKKSDNINELAAALSKAQGEMKPAEFDRTNPHFKSKYATLTSIMASIRDPLAKHGLSVIQRLEGDRDTMKVVTCIAHASGQWLEDDGIPLLLDKNNMQGLGSAFTYAKRYGVSALLAIVSDDDDDGNQATNPEPEVKTATPVKTGKPVIIKQSAPIKKEPAPLTPTPPCDACGAALVRTKKNDAWFCVNYKEIGTGAHTYIKD